MSFNSYNYGGYYNNAQANQQQQPAPSRTYATPTQPTYSTHRSNAPAPRTEQSYAGYGQDSHRYHYASGASVNSNDNTGGWSTVPRYGTSTSNTSSSQHGPSTTNDLYGARSHTPTHDHTPQNITYASHNQTQTAQYGQHQARSNSTASAGSVAQSQQHRPVANPHRSSQDFRTMTRSSMQANTGQHHTYQQTRSPNISYQQTHHQSSLRAESGQSNQISTLPAPTAPITVDPSQVYDRSAEIQREAAKVEAARKAEEDRRKAEEARQKAEEARRKAEEEAKQREQDEHARKVAEARKLSEQGAAKAPAKKRAKKPTADKPGQGDAAANAAAMTLLQTANSGGDSAGGDLEKQMRDMFAKMREFNAKNPDLLSKMWQQERKSYLAGEQTPQTQPNTTTTAPSSQATPAQTKPATPAQTKPATPAQTKPAKKRTPKKDKQITAPPPAQAAATTAPQTQASSTDQTPSAPPPKPVDKAAGKTIWPEKRKAQLAQAASSLILKMPENGGRTITAGEIAKMLDGNPSYLELCTQIEARGFHLNKSQFAKALLTAVPEVNKQKLTGPGTSTSPQIPQPASFTPLNGESAGASHQSPQRRNALTDAENRLMNGQSIIGKSSNGGRPKKPGESPQAQKQTSSHGDANTGVDDFTNQASDHFEGLSAVKQFNERPAGPHPSASSPVVEVAKPKKKPRPSVTPAPPLPQTKEDFARKRTFADLVDLTALSDEENMPTAKRQQMNDDAPAEPQQLPTPPNTISGQASSQSIQQPTNQAPTVPAMGTQQQPQGPRPPIAQPGHLQHYPQPTFPTAPQPQISQIKAHRIPGDHPIHNVVPAVKIAKEKVVRKSKYNPKTIARDVLLATGRHPDMRHLNAHLEPLRNLKIKEDADLSTVRWDVIDPGGAFPGAGVSTEPLPEDELDTFADDESSDNEDMLGGATQSVPIGSGGAATAAVESARHATNPSFRIKQYKPRRSDPGVRTLTTPNRQPHTAAPASAGASSGYSALRSADPTQAKKKGRPVGWRKWMQKDRAGGSPAPAQGTGEKRRGRPPGGGSASKPAKPPSPTFPAFKCEWEGCAAELHNLDTLRRHIHKIHGERRLGPEWTCRWRSCGKATSIKEGPRTVSKFVRRSFEDGEEWKTHVEDEHLLQIKWKQGDGPAAGLTEGDGEVSDAVLSDREGRQVTPRISMPSSPAEAFQAAEEERSAGGQGPAPDTGSGRWRRTPLEEAQMELYHAEERRRRLGVGIDKGGATLANDKRRRGFVEDGDVEMVSDEE